jgi:hypothetical protein
VLQAPAVAARSIIGPLAADVGSGIAEMKFSPLLSRAALFIVGRVREDDIPETQADGFLGAQTAVVKDAKEGHQTRAAWLLCSHRF